VVRRGEVNSLIEVTNGFDFADQIGFDCAVSLLRT